MCSGARTASLMLTRPRPQRRQFVKRTTSSLNTLHHTPWERRLMQNTSYYIISPNAAPATEEGTYTRSPGISARATSRGRGALGAWLCDHRTRVFSARGGLSDRAPGDLLVHFRVRFSRPNNSIPNPRPTQSRRPRGSGWFRQMVSLLFTRESVWRTERSCTESRWQWLASAQVWAPRDEIPALLSPRGRQPEGKAPGTCLTLTG